MRMVLSLLLASAAFAPAVRAQTDSLPASRPHNVGVLELGAVLGAGLVVQLVADGPIANAVQAMPDGRWQDAARFTRTFNQPEIAAGITGALVTIGAVAGERSMVRVGAELGEALVMTQLLVKSGKWALGRQPPGLGFSATDYAPLGAGAGALPSGQAAWTFALATTLSDALHSPVASVALYGAATSAVAALVVGREHWTSDVLVGAAIGVASAKFTNGRWTLFGLRAPRILPAPGGAVIGWSAKF